MTSDTHHTGFACKLFSSLALALLLFAAPAWAQDGSEDVEVITPVRMDTLESLSAVEAGEVATQPKQDGYEVPNNEMPQRFLQKRDLGEDPVRQMTGGQRPSNPPSSNFDGLGVTDNEDVIGGRVAPPDPEVDVGEEYILQEVNLLYSVYDKETGEQLLGPLENNAIFAGFGGDCENTNTGDVITLYDEEADRWLSSFMSFEGDNPGTECIAISQTSDPTGGWYRYEFVISSSENNDYPKLGVGPNAYYSSYNMFDFGFTGGKVAAHDREAMINGDSDATMILFGPNSDWFTLMPADIDGPVPSPSPGGLFGQIAQDQFEVFQMQPDFENPDNSTFEQIATLSTEPFDSDLCSASRDACVPQPDGPDLESLAGRLMQRLQFRDMGDYHAMVTNHTVDVDGEGTAGIRWYELRDESEDGSWEIYQEGTYAPGDGLNRWMGSIAMNSDGAIGLIYTASSNSQNPSIRYTGRPQGAPLGQMTFQEEIIQEGEASQQGTARWGDYSALDIDPSNGVSFWGTHQYAPDIGGQFNWDTRIAEFQFDVDDETPPEAISDLSAAPTGPTTVELTWAAPSDPPDGDPAAGYDIRYSTDPIETESDFESAQQLDGEPSPSEPGVTDTASVAGLTPDTEYFFAIRSSDFTGNTSDLNTNLPVAATTDAAPIVGTDPDSLSQTLNTGESGSDVLSVLNEGAGTLDFALTPEIGGTEIANPLGGSAPTTSAGEFPEGKYEPSAGTPPENGQPTVKEPRQRVYQPDIAETVYVGVNAATNQFVSFQGNQPEVFNQIGAYPSSAGFPNAGDYPSDDNAFTYDLNDDGTLRTINTETGEIEEVGNVGVTGWCGMATDPSSGQIYVNTCEALYTLNPDAPSVELVGEFSVGLMIDIAIDGEGQMYGYDVANDLLYEINKDTGEITEVGSIGFDANFGQGLTWDTKNQELLMFAFNNATFQPEFRSVDRETGSTELIGVLGASDPGGTNQLGWGATTIDAIPQWLTATPTEGEVEAGGSQDIDLTYQTAFEAEDEDDLIGGLNYLAEVSIESNDPSTPTTSVPVTLTVEGNPAIGFSDEPLDFGEVFAGTSQTDTLSIINESDDAILQVADLELESESFTLLNTSSFVLDPGESMGLPITFAPDDSDTFEGTLSLASSAGDQEVGIVGQGVPFVSIAPDSLEQSIDLTTGDSTATQEFTVTNEFGESLPFSVVIETLEGSSGNSLDLTPKLTDEQLRRWRQLQKRAPRSTDVEPSLKTAPNKEGGDNGPSAVDRFFSQTQSDPTGVTAYANDLIGENIVSFDIGVPGEFTAVDDFVDSFAGNFAFANNEEIYWIDNEDGSLKTYALEDGSVTTVGELSPESSDEGWTDMETDPTSGTTYVTTSFDPGGGFVTRLYELDVDDAELSYVGEFDGLGIALAIDGSGAGYVHEITNDEILTVDLDAAEADVVGPTGIDANFAQSMTWDGETGQVLMAALHDCGFFGCGEGTLRQVNRETGNTTAIGAFPDAGSNELTWFATPGLGIQWLSTNLTQGTLPAGATLTLEAQFDASETPEGDYDAKISIVGDELQGEPSESLPVNFSVEAKPVLFLSKDGLEYDSTFVNDTTSTQLVTLRNDGLANMNVSDVSVSENFVVTPNPDSAFTLEPGDARIFEVAFTPTTTGELEGSLSFEGDEVSGEVSLTGTGIPAPELAVDPASFEKQAYLGQTQEETVIVSNPGGNPLEYDLSVLPTTPPPQDILLAEETFDGEFPPDGWTRGGLNDGENWTTDCFGGPEDQLPAAVHCWFPSYEGTQRLISPQLNSEGLPRVVVQFNNYIDNFSSDASYELRLETSGDGGETWTTVKTWDPQDLDPAITETITIDNEDVGSDEFHVAWTFDGDSFEINEWVVDDVSVFAEGDFLSVAQESGTVAPSSTDTLDLTIDTNVPGLEEGTFQSGINFSTNDPTARSLDLPFTLNVIEELSVEPHPSAAEVNPNEDFSVDFNVESLDDLDVFSYEMEMNFNTDRMQVQEVVTEGTLSEDLILSSSIDNEAGTVSVVAADASGSGPEGEGVGDSQPLFDIEGQGTLISINATGQPDHGEMTLDMSKMLFNEGEPPASAKDSTMSVVPLYGDVNLNLSITTADASDVLDFVVGNIDLGEAQQTQADVSGNGEVSGFDASLILRRTVGDITCFPVVPSCSQTEPALASKSGDSKETPDISFAWGDVTRNAQATTQSTSTDPAADDGGKVVSVPLVVDQAVWDNSYGSVRSIQVSTEIDQDKVSVQEVKAHLPDDWRMIHNVSDNGTLKISMAGISPLAKVGKLATLTLQREDANAKVKVSGNVAVNESSTRELEAKSIVSIPDEFAIEGTNPNPFRQAATLTMDLPEKANVTVEVYDLLGRKIQTAHSGEMSAGAGRTVRIDGTDLPSGTYFYRARVEMENTTRTESGKMTVVQ